MNHKILTVMIALLAIFVSGHAQKDVEVDIRAVTAVNTKLEAALSNGDENTVDQMLAATYLEIDAQGTVKKKADVMALARARRTAPPSQSVGPEIKVEEITLLVHNDTAVYVTLTSTKYQFQDYQTTGAAQAPEILDRERRLRVYSRDGGRWQLVAQQTTAVAKR